MKGQGLIAALLLTILLTASLPAQTSTDGSPWWTPEGVDVTSPSHYDRAWNLRVPLRVTADAQPLAIGQPVQAHLDLGQEAVEAGWVTKDGKPTSFTLDTQASIRLVEYTRNWNAIKDVVPVAVTVHEGWLEPDQTSRYGRMQGGEFDASTNPVVTLEWKLQDQIPARGSVDYYAYFDITQNTRQGTDKPDAVHTIGTKESMQGMYWADAGVRLFGHHPGRDTWAPTLVIMGTEDDTQVTVYTYPGTSTFPVKDDSGRAGNPSLPFTLDAGDAQQWTLGLSSTHFMVEATRPVIALTQAGSGSGEFIPSTTGGLSGTHFFIPPGTQGVHVIAPRLDAEDPNEEVTFTATGLQDQSRCTQGSTHRVSAVPGGTFWCYMTAQQAQGIGEILVTNGHPVLVQHNPPTDQKTWSQTPSIHGSPLGTEMLPITLTNQDGGLTVSSPKGSTVSVQDRSGPVWNDLEEDLSIAPGQSQRLSGQGWPTQFSSQQGGPSPPLVVTADDSPVRVLHGAKASAASSAQTTPFGGDSGREFRVETPFVVQAFYEGTVIEDLSLDALSVTGKPLSRSQAFVVSEGGKGLLETNKPVSVFPMGDAGDYRRYLAAQPSFIEPTTESGDYRGYLINVQPTNGQGTVFVEAIPPETVRVPFLVENLARWDGVFLPDGVDLSATTTPGDWPGGDPFFEIEGAQSNELQLDSPGAKLAYVNIPIPQGAQANDKVTVQVEARSQENPQMGGSFSVVVYLRPHYEVEMWYGPPGSDFGVATLSHSFELGEVQNIPQRLFIKNLGTVTDSFKLTTQGGGSGWSADYLLNGQSVNEVTLAAGEKIDLTMEVSAPQTKENADTVFTTTATSQEGPGTVTDRVRMFAFLALDRDISMDSEEPLLLAKPGENVTFTVALHNNGDDLVTLDLDLIDTLAEGWDVEIVGGDSTKSVSKKSKVDIKVKVKVPDDASAHALGTVLVRAQGSNSRDNDVQVSTALTVEVAEVEDIQLEGPATITAESGEDISLSLNITNNGNADKVVRIFPLAPSEWNATLPPSVMVPTHGASTASLNLQIPQGALAGSVPVKIFAQAGGVTAIHDIQVDIKPHHNLTWIASEPVLVRPGEDIVIPVSVSNAGNTHEMVTVTATGPGGQTINLEPAQLDIPQGATRSTVLSWSVPDEANERISLNLKASTSDTVVTSSLHLDVQPLALEVEHIVLPDHIPEVGEVAFVTVILHNPTNVAVKGVQVSLTTADRLIDGVRFESMGPGGNVVAPLRWVREAGDTVPTLEWGIQDGTAVTTIGTQQLQLADTDDVGRTTPSVPVWFLGLVLACVTVIARMQRNQSGEHP